MNEKPLFPFSQGQIFENMVYRRWGTAEISERKRFINDTLNLRNSKYLFVENSVDFLTLSDRPYGDTRAQRKKISHQFCGYPINPKVSQKLFSFTKPFGHWFSKYDDSIFDLITKTPLIPFSVIKAIKSLSSTGIELPRGTYFSIGNISSEADRNSHSMNIARAEVPADFSAVQTRKLTQKIFKIMDRRWRSDCFSAQNLFIPSRAFVDSNELGLLLLPNKSICWLWHDGKWKTVKVVSSPMTGDKMSTKFTEISLQPNGKVESKLCLLEICGHEIQNHRKIAQLLEQDDLRIAIRSLNVIAANNMVVHPRSLIVNMIAKNFNSEFLDPYKMAILKSTEYKNMSSFNEFGVAMVKKFPPLVFSLLSNETIDALAEYAVLAAQQQTPLFWGIDPVLKSGIYEDLKTRLTHAGFISDSRAYSTLNQYALYHMGVRSDEIENELHTTVKVDFCATVSKPVTKHYKVKPSKEVSVMVPKYIADKGQDMVKKFVKYTLDKEKDEYSIRQYKTIEEPERYSTGMNPKITFNIDLSSITIK
jgi:hypothetical protein